MAALREYEIEAIAMSKTDNPSEAQIFRFKRATRAIKKFLEKDYGKEQERIKRSKKV